MLLDSLAIRVDGPRAWAEDLTIDLVLTDEERRYRLTLHNGVLTHRSCPAAPARARETGPHRVAARRADEAGADRP